MQRIWIKISLIAIVVCAFLNFPFVTSHASESAPTLELQADGAIAEASNGGAYPTTDVVRGDDRDWSNTPDSLPATVSYWGPPTTLYCNPSSALGYGDDIVSGNVIDFQYAVSQPETDVTCTTANGLTAEVEVPVLPH